MKFGNTYKHIDDMIISLRNNNFSINNIVGVINSKGYNITSWYVYSLKLFKIS